MSDSYAPVVVEIALFSNNAQPVAEDNSSFGGNTAGAGTANQREAVYIPYQDYLQSFEVEVKAGGAWTGTMVLFDRQGSFLEDIILAAGVARSLVFRWDWDSASGLTEAPSWVAGITKYSPAFTAEGVTLTLELTSNSALSSTINRDTPDKVTWGYRAGFKMSQMVLALANKFGWPTEKNGKSTIEFNDPVLERSVSNSNAMSPVRFVREKLLPNATEEPNSEHYVFYFDSEGTVHYHTPRFLNDEATGTYQLFRFARDAMGDVISFEPEDDTLAAAINGAGNCTFEGIDSLEGTRLSQGVSQTEGVEGTNRIISADSAYVTDLGDGQLRRIQITERTREEFRRRLAAHYDKLAWSTIRATLRVLGTHSVDMMEPLRVEYLKQNGQQHYLSGLYHVYGIKHTFDSGGWVTEYELLRRGRGWTPDNPAEQRRTGERSPRTTDTRNTGSVRSQVRRRRAR